MQSRIFSTDGVSHSGETLLFEPPRKLDRGIYRCDKMFSIDNVVEMYDTEETYAIVLVSGDAYEIYAIVKTGIHIECKTLLHNTIRLPNKHRNGGQSAQRFGRIRQIVRGKFVTQIAEDCAKVLIKNNHTECIAKKIIVGGPAEMKSELVQHPLFQQYFKSKIFDVVACDSISKSVAIDIFNQKIGDINALSIKDIDISIDNAILFRTDYVSFGNECIQLAQDSMLDSLYVSNDVNDEVKEMLRNVKCKLVFSHSHKIKIYGMMVGIRHYVTNDDITCDTISA